jgi:hypothetical protein
MLANALPNWRSVSILFESSPIADKGKINEEMIKDATMNLMREDILCSSGFMSVVIFWPP